MNGCDNIFVKIETVKADTFYKFTRSLTGILDFAGSETPSDSDLESMQNIEASSFYTPSWYSYLPEELQTCISIYLPAEIQNLDTAHFSFLAHIGAVLLAIQTGDPLLAAELINRRKEVFANFTPIMLHVLRGIAPEALFAFVYGGFSHDNDFDAIYKANAPIGTGETNTVALLFAAAKEALKPEPTKESAEQMFIRYFAKTKGKFMTLGLVGAINHPWIDGIENLEKIAHKAADKNFTSDISAAGKKIQQIYGNLSVTMQAEPYNPHDHNAIGVHIDDLNAIIKGSKGKCKAGYIRATAASILRKARPQQFAYKAILWRLGKNPDYFENAIILRIKL